MPWRAYLLSNLGLKIFALLLATLIWFSVRIKIDHAIHPPSALNTAAKRTLPEQPVRVLTDPARAGLWQLEPARVAVTVSGDLTLLGKLDPGDVQVFVQPVEFPNTDGATNKVQVLTPPGVTLLQVAPLHVRLQRVRP